MLIVLKNFVFNVLPLSFSLSIYCVLSQCSGWSGLVSQIICAPGREQRWLVYPEFDRRTILDTVQYILVGIHCSNAGLTQIVNMFWVGGIAIKRDVPKPLLNILCHTLRRKHVS